MRVSARAGRGREVAGGGWGNSACRSEKARSAVATRLLRLRHAAGQARPRRGPVSRRWRCGPWSAPAGVPRAGGWPSRPGARWLGGRRQSHSLGLEKVQHEQHQLGVQELCHLHCQVVLCGAPSVGAHKRRGFGLAVLRGGAGAPKVCAKSDAARPGPRRAAGGLADRRSLLSTGPAAEAPASAEAAAADAAIPSVRWSGSAALSCPRLFVGRSRLCRQSASAACKALPRSQATVCARHPAAARPACAPHRSARSARCPISVASPATASAGWRYWRRRGLTARQPSPGQRQRHHEAGPGPDAGAR